MLTTLIRSDGLPWTGLGTRYETHPQTSDEIVTQANLNWEVAAAQLYSNEFGPTEGYYEIYRKDNQRRLGVVKAARLMQVQNIDMFKSIEPILQNGTVKLDTSARFGNTDNVFGTFEIAQDYSILDDNVKHYLVVINDHMKPDGRITVLNTPVRVACMNVMAEALSKNLYSMRVPVSSELTANRNHASDIIMQAETAISQLKARAEKMYSQKIEDSGIDKMMDIILPYPELDGITEASTRKAEDIEMQREIFVQEYLNADNLQNFKGTNWGVYQAVADFSQHAWKKVDSAYNLDARMKKLPGLGEKTIVQKYLAVVNDLIAA